MRVSVAAGDALFLERLVHNRVENGIRHNNQRRLGPHCHRTHADTGLVEIEVINTDPAFAGTMTMTWELSAESSGTRVQVRADNVPSGISAEDHAAGLASSLANLAAYIEA